MSLIPAEYTVPFPSNSSVLLAALASNQDWWTYRQLRALQTNYTEGQLVHKPFYHPLISLTFTKPSPIQVGSEHYFEWRITDWEEIIFMFHLVINPSYGFFAPHTFIQSNSHQAYPTIFSVWYDCPHYAPTQLINYLENDLSYIWPDHAPIKFLKSLQVFINDYFRPVAPFSPPQDCYPLYPLPTHSPQSSEHQ